MNWIWDFILTYTGTCGRVLALDLVADRTVLSTFEIFSCLSQYFDEVFPVARGTNFFKVRFVGAVTLCREKSLMSLLQSAVTVGTLTLWVRS